MDILGQTTNVLILYLVAPSIKSSMLFILAAETEIISGSLIFFCFFQSINFLMKSFFVPFLFFKKLSKFPNEDTIIFFLTESGK